MRATDVRVRNAHLAAAAHGGAPSGSVATEIGRFRPGPSLLATVALILVLSASGEVLDAETAVAAQLGRLAWAPDAVASGTTVLFSVGDRATGYTLTLACSAVLLLVPFLVVTAVLTGVRRVRARAAFAALVLAAAVIATANQLRIAVITGAMHALGPEQGYAVTHVAVGAVVSTLGTVAAGAVYLLVLLRGSRGVRRG